MRINKFLAQVTGISRRAADAAVAAGEVTVQNPATSNSRLALAGQEITASDTILFHEKHYTLGDIGTNTHTTILLNKPAGYVVSRNGQGSKTIYDLLPTNYHHLKPVGRLDKDSSGLLLVTNDGTLAHELTHPSRRKTKRYEVTLNKPLQPLHRQMISDYGIQLQDGPSKLQLNRIDPPQTILQDAALGYTTTDRPGPTGITGDLHWLVSMHEGRNRQIRRTFAALGYNVTRLHRIQFGDYFLDALKPGAYQEHMPKSSEHSSVAVPAPRQN